MACINCTSRNTKCRVCGTEYILLPANEFQHLQETRIALESSRADLWGVNEELRDKIKKLEAGQEELIEENNRLKSTSLPPSLVDDLDGIASSR